MSSRLVALAAALTPTLAACAEAEPLAEAPDHLAARQAFEALPELPTLGACTRLDLAVSLTPVDGDGTACSTDCPWEETEVLVTLENGCEAGELALPLTDGCLSWLYKIRDEIEQASVARGVADCEDPGLDEVILAPGESWTEVVPVEIDPDLSGGADLTFSATTHAERRYSVSLSLVAD